jgi:sec-independent protein translocase protein TatC
MRNILKRIWLFLTAPFLWLFKGIEKLIRKSFLGVLLAEDPEDIPLLDTIQKVTEEPKVTFDSALEHITTLRKHLLRAVIFLILTSALSFVFIEEIMAWLTHPIGGIGELKAIEVTESIGVVMRITFISGFVISLPYISFEILLFVSSGLTRRERLIGMLGIPFVTIFFTVGAIFAYYFMLPAALSVLVDFMDIQTDLRPNSYFRFATGIMFWIGIGFEFPLVALVLSYMRVLSAKMLIDHWRLAFILLAILAAMITPTVDPYNMLVVLLPLWVLYGLSILMARIGSRKPKQTPMNQPEM